MAAYGHHRRATFTCILRRGAVAVGVPLALLLLVERGWCTFVGPPALDGHRPSAAEPFGLPSPRSRSCETPPTLGRASAGAKSSTPNDPPGQDKGLSAGSAVAAGPAAAVAAGVGVGVGLQDKVKQDAVQTLGLGALAAALFCGWVYASRGWIPATEWISCYVIEYSLSIDNLFVFIIIFKYFKVPTRLQQNVLNLGILGAIIFRFVFVYLGAMVLQQFESLILGFAAILIYASYTGFTKEDEDDDDDDNLDNNMIVQNLRKVLPVSPKMDGENFVTEIDGKVMITPLLLCLLTIEFSDIVFATDSVPAVLGTTRDQFVAYTSNIFAVFGLRALFFLLQEAMVSFAYLESAVNVVLGFIGVKIVLDFFELVQIDVLLSLAIILGTLFIGVALSISEMKGKNEVEGDEPSHGK